MTDELSIPVTIHGASFTELLAPERAGFHMPPPGPSGRGFQMREWPLGEVGMLATTEHGDLVHLDVTAAAADAASVVEPDPVRTVDRVTARIPFGARATVASGVPGSDDRQLRMVTIGDGPERWLRVEPSGLLVGLRGEDELAALAFHTRVRRPTERRVLLRAGSGWSADTMQWHSSDGQDAGTSVQLHRPHPSMDDPAAWQDQPMAGPTNYEHEPSLDLTANLVLVDGALDHLDAQVQDGIVALPDVIVEMEQLEVELTWPARQVNGVLDRDAGVCQFDVGTGDPTRWLAVGDGLLAGVDGADALVTLIATRVTVQPAMDHMAFGMSLDPADQAAQMRMMTEQMQEQFASEHAAALAFAAAPTFKPLGPVGVPASGPRSMRLIDGVSPGHVTGIDLVWGDEMGGMLPGGDPTAPVTVVHHARPMFVPEGLPMHHDEHLGWLEGLRMQRAHAAMQSGDVVTGDLQSLEESGAFGPDEHHRRIAALSELAQPTMLIVQGEELPATIVQSEHGYVVRAQRDGWDIVLRSTLVEEPVPALDVVDELAPFVAGMAEQQERMRAWHLEMAVQMEQAPAAPAEPVAARTAAQQLVGGLQFSRGMMGPPPPGFPAPVDPADAFATDIVTSWGGDDAFRTRFGLLQRLASVSGAVGDVARDGSAAQAILHVNLPRPDGMGVGFSIGVSGDWWDHDPDDIRRSATRQLDREQQGEYELRFNALVERGVDGDYRIVTDVLRLVDEHVGGLQRLLDPAR